MKKTTSVYSSYFIDTNIFLRTLVREEVKMHGECLALLRAVREGGMRAHTSSLVIAEIVWTLKSFYKLSKGEVLVAVQGITALRNLRVESKERVEVALDLYAKHNVKFIDTLIASSEDVQKGITCVVSYDKEFDRIPGVVRKEPSEVLTGLVQSRASRRR